MMEKTVTPEILEVPFLATLGEGPVWLGNKLAWVDIKGRKLNIADLDGSDHVQHETPQMIGFAVPHADGGWLAGFEDGLWRSDAAVSDWRRAWHASHPTETHRINDGKTDPRGRTWFGSMTHAEKEPVAALYRLDAAGVSQQVAGITTSNGLDWSPDGKTFYYTDSIPRVIWAYDFDMDSGELRNPRVFARDPDAYVPDGCAIDDEGCLWSAKWNGGRVIRYAPDGRIDLIWHLPVTSPTSCAFAGDDRSVLAVTSARLPELGHNSELDGSVLLIPTQTTGPAMTSASH